MDNLYQPPKHEIERLQKELKVFRNGHMAAAAFFGTMTSCGICWQITLIHRKKPVIGIFLLLLCVFFTVTYFNIVNTLKLKYLKYIFCIAFAIFSYYLNGVINGDKRPTLYRSGWIVFGIVIGVSVMILVVLYLSVVALNSLSLTSG